MYRIAIFELKTFEHAETFIVNIYFNEVNNTHDCYWKYKTNEQKIS